MTKHAEHNLGKILSICFPRQSAINVQSQKFYVIHFGNMTIFMGNVYIQTILIFSRKLDKMFYKVSGKVNFLETI
jgi:hypothetical protein